MKRKTIIALCLALMLTIFSNVSSVFAEDPEPKPFTLTKKVGGTEEKVGDYDKFYDAVGSMDVNDKTTYYTIYVNKNATIPEGEMGGYYRTNSKFRLTSGNGGTFTLTREGKWGILGIQTDSELTVDNITLSGNGSNQCFFISNNGKVTIGEKATIQNFVDTPNEDGSAIHMTGGTLNILPGAVIQNNNSNMQGGAIQAYNGTTVNISGGTFKDNKSNTSDGGFLATHGTLNITGGTFEGNTAKKTGGAVIVGSRAVATISNATFKNNKASTGGAVYSSCELSISKITFENNEAEWGGAVFASKKLTLSDSTFNENTATSAGGALYLQGGAEIKDSEFASNSAVYNGGAIYANRSNLIINNSEFKENKGNNAGAIYILNAQEESAIKDCSFTNNIANEQGGALWSNYSKTTIDNGIFDKNISGNYGGALCFNDDKEFTVKNSTIKNNESKLGGGIFAVGGSLSIEESTIDSNIVENVGGGILSLSGGSVGIKNCTVKNNQALNGAGVTVDAKTVKIEGTEFNNNDTGKGENQEKRLGGGLYIGEKASVTISESSKFINNKAGVGGAIFDAALSYDNPTDTTKYQNLTIDKSTEFKDNIARTNLYAPPTNYDKFGNLNFSDTSDIPHMKGMSKSLLNNYDINYKGDFVIAYDANGGKFEDGKAEKTENHKDNDEITIAAAPVREGYKFTGWKGTKVTSDAASAKEVTLKPGDKFKIDGNYTFVAQWEKPEPKPQPKDERQIIFFGKPKQEPTPTETHIAYINGYPDNTVRPEGKITRAEAVTMVVRLKAYPMIEGAGIYKDVAKDAWYAPYVEAAYRQGILEEKAGEAFRPDENITRGELAQLISHIDKKNDAKAPFTDVEGYKYKAAIDQSYGNERILGYPDNTFRPDAEITRAETAAMLNRLFERCVRAEGIKNVEVKIFIDLQDTNYWAYYDIIEASHTHTYVRIRPNTVEELWKTVIK